jgi:internalin A
LSNLTKLSSLTINKSPIKDISPLAGLIHLTWLDLRQTDVGDLTPLTTLSELEYLFLDETLVSDLRPLMQLENLISLGIADCKQIRDYAIAEELDAYCTVDGIP